LAIVMVLLLHFVGQTASTNVYEAAVNRVLSFGFLGVDLFFVLSGFLITGILYDARTRSGYFRRFYMRRALRIFPLYYAVLAVFFFVLPAVPALSGVEMQRLRSEQAWAWLYGVNVYVATHGGWGSLSYLEHFWSLAVEEHFYLVWPVVVWALGSRPRLLMRTALGLAALSSAARTAASLAGVSAAATTVLTPFQLDALCLGGVLAVWLRQPGGEAAARRAILPMAASAAALIVLQVGLHRFTDAGLDLMRATRLGVFRVLFGALLLQAVFASAASPLGRVLRAAPLRTLGKYSYGLYVYHHFLSYYFITHGTEFALARVVGSHTLAVALQAAGGIAVSIAVAVASYELFEKRFLELKRFWPSAEEREGTLDSRIPKLVRARPVGRVAGAALGVALCAAPLCESAGAPAEPATSTTVARVAPARTSSDGYVIGVADVLKVTVWKEPDLTLEVTVRPDGMITVPLLGDVPASGRTPILLASGLANGLEEFIERPRVTVSVGQATSARVYVIGQMMRPGEFPLLGRMTVLKALALAGGFKDYAKPESIVIVREDQSVIPFNYKRVTDGKDVAQNVLLAPGDTIVVP
jgi:peptidoglycan/LPS O-acetylase OafA/YrhL/protein involved in polysaccharide export with SLBB domain